MENYTLTEITIRPAVEQDLPLIESFDIFAGDRNLEISEERMQVCCQGQDLLGYISCSRSGLIGNPFVSYLVVNPDQRRQGVATRLIQAAESAHAGQRLFISTESDNQSMLALLDKLAYLSAGEITGVNKSQAAELFFYRDIGCD